MKKESKGTMSMRGFPMPKEHKEIHMKCLGVADTRYVDGEFSNPSELEKNNNAQAAYVRTHKAKW